MYCIIVIALCLRSISTCSNFFRDYLQAIKGGGAGRGDGGGGGRGGLMAAIAARGGGG
jgi:hypothetical protein